MRKNPFVIVDANALLHRSFHALPPLTTKKGEPTGAIYGFLLTLFKVIEDLRPEYLAVCFDLPGPTFRHREFESYKAQRPKTPEPLVEQIAKTKEILKSFNIPIFEKEGFEADDLIATISIKAKRENKNLKSYILSGDLDTLQLVDENTEVYSLGRGIRETIIYNEEKVFSRFGVKPEQIVDFKSLTGDPSDNIPGVEGIGKKTASELLKRFKSLKNLYRTIEKEGVDINQKIKKILLKNKERVFLSQKLIRIKKDVPLDFKIERCQIDKFNFQEGKKILKEFEFFSLIKRLENKINVKTKNKKLF